MFKYIFFVGSVNLIGGRSVKHVVKLIIYCQTNAEIFFSSDIIIFYHILINNIYVDFISKKEEFQKQLKHFEGANVP